MTFSLQISNAIGARVSVALNSEDDLLDAMRFWGQRRWRTIDLPYGGLHFPLAMAETFDWTIIGAQPGEQQNDEGGVDKGVWFQNRFWKRRDLPANEKKKMDAAVKYSRGANDADRSNPNLLVEGDDKFGYVTLVIFRGTGKVQAQYERPRAQQQTEPAAKTEKMPDEQVQAIREVARKGGMAHAALVDLSVRMFGTSNYPALSPEQGRRLADAIAQSVPKPAPAAATQTKPDDADPATTEILASVAAAAKHIGLSHQELTDLCIRTLGRPSYEGCTTGQARALYAAIAHYRAA